MNWFMTGAAMVTLLAVGKGAEKLTCSNDQAGVQRKFGFVPFFLSDYRSNQSLRSNKQ